jgi:prephenate dehydrogenase
MKAREKQLCERIVVWSRRAESRDNCAVQTWCDAVCDDPKTAVKGSDLVVICTPVKTIPTLLETITPALQAGTLLTDVGSTKQLICAKADQLSGETFNFVGAHPMAGSEKSGLAHARADLFDSAACILTPTSKTQADAVATIQAFWQALGTRVYTMSAEAHDETVAHISHLPHLLAAAICSNLNKKDSIWAELSGPGLRDTTRVAAGDPDLWQQILLQNKSSVLSALEEFEASLARFKGALQDEDDEALRKLLGSGKEYRDQINHD